MTFCHRNVVGTVSNINRVTKTSSLKIQINMVVLRSSYVICKPFTKDTKQSKAPKTFLENLIIYSSTNVDDHTMSYDCTYILCPIG